MSLPRFPAYPLAALLLACQPSTTRPAFGPLPTAVEAIVDLDVARATTRLAEELASDSIPMLRVAPRDGYLESPWFSARTGTPSLARPLGDSLVRVRGWIHAYGTERAAIRVETALRPLANPSLPPRELDRQAAPDNPAALRVARVRDALVRRFPVPGTTPPAATPPPRGVTEPAAPPPGDSTAAPPSEKIIKPFRGPPATPNP
jgi:hypothetical protein